MMDQGSHHGSRQCSSLQLNRDEYNESQTQLNRDESQTHEYKESKTENDE